MVEREITDYYTEFGEAQRLHTTATGRLELLRTQELVRSLLPPGAARILDVGGGPGTHARWLAEDGHTVHLVDPVPKHLAQAAAYAACTTELGDARALTAADASFDVVLLLGPLYHLTARADRMAALAEAVRVARPGGIVAAAGISRYSLLQDYTVHAGLTPELLHGEVADVLRHGGYDGSRGFTLAHFHTGAELRDEAVAAGLTGLRVHGIEGPGWAYLRAAERTAGAPLLDSPLLDGALATARLADHHPDVIDASAHILVAGRTPPEVGTAAVSDRRPPSDLLPARPSAPVRR
ncbi:class I SAM-dependent methyltransferase [Streptomyces erythrochromogenes]|uniref:class I SAM-dependent methyltransferase n=1 Tax=Streptomyces erythrochromogenes TaxID=285574 RepID=UPI00381544D4|nr:class I SAM-dependent methyltransferase [Streptomyces erythrochromogenes]